MKKTFKMVGVAAIVVALVCNLQYSLFAVKNNPFGVKAEFTYDNTLYCGTDNGTHTGFRVGTWMYRLNDATYDFYAYEGATGFYYFVPSNSGSQCGLPDEDTDFRYSGYVVTDSTPTMTP